MNEVVEWLVEDFPLSSPCLRPPFFTSNQYAAAVAQIDPATLAPVGQTGNGQPAYGVPVLTTPLHDKNIKGQGQVVGVGDTGLDYDACHFKDPARKINQAEIPSGPTGAPKNFPNHRKIVQYRGYADSIEGSLTGHGTHVAGSVAGNTAEPIGNNPPRSGGPKAYDGSAPEAKVAFFDIGRPGERGLRVPQSLQTSFYPPA